MPSIRQASAGLVADVGFGTEGIHLHNFMGAIMGRINPNRVGLSVAAVLAGWHVIWSLLVAFGEAQRVLEVAQTLHGMKADAVVGPFSPAMAAVLVLVTAIIGYVSGAAGALTWNCLQSWCAGAAVCSQPAAGSAQSSPRHAA